MTDRIEAVAKVAEQGGAAVAVGSSLAWLGGLTTWLNHNSDAVLALCGIIGAVVSIAGYITNLIYQERKFQHFIRSQDDPD